MGNLAEFKTYAINYMYKKRYERRQMEKEADIHIYCNCENTRKESNRRKH